MCIIDVRKVCFYFQKPFEFLPAAFCLKLVKKINNLFQIVLLV